MSLYIKKTFKYGGKNISLETGKIAKNTNGSVVITIDNTVVLCTVVVNKNIKNQDYFPLSVYYQEKTYAAGKIPGGFLKREGRPTEKEILTSRLIDRPIRPNINKFYKNEVQIICTVISAEKNPDIAAMIGTYAAIGISDIPLIDIMGVARVGFNKEIGYWLNITNERNSELDIVVAGTKNSVLMVEAEAKEKTESIMLGAICYAHREMQLLINNINEFVVDYTKKKKNKKNKKNKKKVNISEKLVNEFNDSIKDTFYIMEKIKRKEALCIIINQVIEKFINNSLKYDNIKEILKVIIKKIFINKMLETKKRMDGRKLKTIRSLSIEVGILPSAHGSALFSRGDTQALVAITLGSLRDAQVIEGLEEERYENLMFHYNFTPYCVCEIGFLGIPKRREIGHGNLAKRAILGVLSKEDFPYSIRIVSEITESNGSSSMASICGASLALMDAGVPLSSTVSGVAMGLITNKEKILIITDIVGDEDKFGDMDLKVAGTKTGITALQMDIKKHINNDLIHLTLNQALEAIKNIINKMNLVISKSRKKLSTKAPSNVILKIETEKIRDVIGKGGTTIKQICESTNTTIDIQDDGKIHIYANNKINSQKAIEAINMITEEAKINKIYRGKVIRIMDFGAFVNFMPGTDGLVHISQIISGHVKNIRDFLNEGDIVTVKVLEKDNKGKIKLSIKEIDPIEKAEFEAKIK
ncbi:Polyribonucleotide nucleotidyltransferase [Candidatus Portiera aleyrodidarum]|uniref:Polyribonucleotide nucleotidyltransferase n=1 Tax=Candidatus Portiera aleyrodidarum TV TaxID=1297582 RepID=A0A8D4BPE8_9GAMM|nr:polyribonucleotide nucleotidyltransferase [Candidatus Portiera aleyrodidarum]AGI27005.1 polyribonucleotide nucleotidyltransferase [Candidatus Portiera aleyrodidarum TV]CEI58958.1 Polyribonucleotide nucleotidyltransferase [Candidatus Portiera aleyrodidarum]